MPGAPSSFLLSLSERERQTRGPDVRNSVGHVGSFETLRDEGDEDHFADHGELEGAPFGTTGALNNRSISC